MYSYSSVAPGVSRYDSKNWVIPYGIEEVTVGEEPDAVQQYRHQQLLIGHNPTDDDVRSAIAGQLCSDVNAYINVHYDPGTQQTLQALMIMDTVPQAVKDDILTIWPWIQSALGYYYAKKAEVLGAEDPKLVMWDFAQFDATKPAVTLAGIMTTLAG